MVRIGIVGIGFMGMIHYLAYQNVKGAKVVAIATRDPKKRAGDWRGIQGNFGPKGTVMDLQGITPYADWQELVHDPKVDVVDVCLPPAMHPSVSIGALSAGIHALCEKPIALTVAEGKSMVAAARKAGKQLLIGQVLPFFPEYAYAYRTIRSGKFGRLLGGHFKRVIADPLWLSDFYDPLRVGGPVVDLHIHDAHFIRLICGMPQAVFSTGRMRGEVVEFVNTQFLFDDPGLSVTAASGVVAQQGRSFTHAFEIYLEKATLVYDFSVLDQTPVAGTPLTVLHKGNRVEQPKLGEVDAFASELGEVVRAVRGDKPSRLLTADLALDALALCHKQTQSVRLKRLVKI